MKFLIFVFLSAFVLLQIPSSMAVQIDDTLVLYLSFDEELEDEEMSDLSEYGNNGEIKGEPEWENGKFGKALWLDGVDDYVQVPDSESLRVDEGVTVMAWIRAERYGYPGNNFQGIVAKSNSPRSYSLYTFVNNQGLHFSTWNPSGVPNPNCGSTSTAKVPLEEWVHIAAVGEAGKDGGGHKYYINGELGGQKSIAEMTALPGDTDLKPTLIGRTEPGQFFLGAIDEVRIWDRALSAEEIKRQMNIGREQFLSVQPQSKLAATWAGIKK